MQLRVVRVVEGYPMGLLFGCLLFSELKKGIVKSCNGDFQDHLVTEE